jgi:hypothetical protein
MGENFDVEVIERVVNSLQEVLDGGEGEDFSRDDMAETVRFLRKKIQDERNPGEISDGYHTFNELYHHRAVLFSVICNLYPEKCWKSKLHHDGSMFDGMFIVGIETNEGQATYHYDVDPYWDYFDVKVLDRAPEWDGHTPSIAIDRIRKFGISSVEELKIFRESFIGFVEKLSNLQ